MTYHLLWIFLLILPAFVSSFPTQNRYDITATGIDPKPGNTSLESPRYEDTSESQNEQVISVRITSSVAVGRGKEKLPYSPGHHQYEPENIYSTTKTSMAPSTELAPHLTSTLIGANVEYIKQLHAKKDSRDHHSDQIHPFQLMHGQPPIENESSQSVYTKINEYSEDLKNVPTARKVPSTLNVNHFQEHKENHGYQHSAVDMPIDFYNRNSQLNLTTDDILRPSKFGMRINLDKKQNDNHTVVANKKELRDLNPFVSNSNSYQTDDSIAESSIKSVGFAKTTVTVPPSTSYIHNRRLIDEQNNPRLTTVTFNVVHDATKTPNTHETSDSYMATSQVVPNEPQFYSEPAKFYSEPAKFYSEPAKIYSEPAKIYSEPAKVYSEPAKIYSEPSKFYSEPASLHLNENIPNVPPSVPPNYSPWQPQHSISGSTTINTTPITTITNGYQAGHQMEHQPERNYEVDEKISVLTDGRSHGIQESSTEKCKQDNCKVGYVVEGRQYKKYRVEERTADGFIVGEYGVVRNEDGALRGVRYTADSDASPRLIHDALMKFLQLK